MKLKIELNKMETEQVITQFNEETKWSRTKIIIILILVLTIISVFVYFIFKAIIGTGESFYLNSLPHVIIPKDTIPPNYKPDLTDQHYFTTNNKLIEYQLPDGARNYRVGDNIVYSGGNNAGYISNPNSLKTSNKDMIPLKKKEEDDVIKSYPKYQTYLPLPQRYFYQHRF